MCAGFLTYISDEYGKLQMSKSQSTELQKLRHLSGEAQESQNPSFSHVLPGVVQKPTHAEDNNENCCPLLELELWPQIPGRILNPAELCCLSELLLARLERLT